MLQPTLTQTKQIRLEESFSPNRSTATWEMVGSFSESGPLRFSFHLFGSGFVTEHNLLFAGECFEAC